MDIVVTGANGFVGSEIIRFFLKEHKSGIAYAMIRGLGNHSANQRFDHIFEHWQKFFGVPDSIRERVRVIDGDLSAGFSGLVGVVRDAELFFHCAANTDLGSSLTSGRRANVHGTQRALLLASQMPSLRRFVHFSTAYVLGTKRGLVEVGDTPEWFNNAYEQSKWEGEQVVHGSNVPYTIVRPTLVVGDSQHGYMRGYKVIYSAVRAWLTQAMPRAPLNPRASVDIVPIDYVVKAAFKLGQLESAMGETYHLASGRKARGPMELFRYAIHIFKLTNPRMAPPWVASLLCSPVARPFIGHRLRQMVDMMKWHVPYLGTAGRVFSVEKTDHILEPFGIGVPELGDYGDTIFRFCLDSHWGKKPLKLPPFVVAE